MTTRWVQSQNCLNGGRSLETPFRILGKRAISILRRLAGDLARANLNLIGGYLFYVNLTGLEQGGGFCRGVWEAWSSHFWPGVTGGIFRWT